MYLLIIIVIIMNVVQATSYKVASLYLEDSKQFASFTFLRLTISSIAAISMILILGHQIELEYYTLLFGSIGGLSLGINFICTLGAMKKGSVAFVNVFSTAGMIIPPIYGWMFMNISFNILHFLGLIAMIFAASIMILYNNSIKGKTDLKTIIIATISLFTNGLVMLSQNLITFYQPEVKSSIFNLVLFTVGSIFLFLISLYYTIKDKSLNNLIFKMSPKIGLVLVLLGSSVFIISLIVTDLTSILPPNILFPLISGLTLITITITSAIIFKESIKKVSIISIVIAIIGIILLQI